jgi:dimethylaniline monooxygenase (N-oxide forming)
LVGRRYRVLFLESLGQVLGNNNYTKHYKGFHYQVQLHVLGISSDSPLRRSHSIFWDTRTNDEGVPSEGSFHALADSGKISLVSPARAAKFGDDGRSVILDDGRVFPAAAVILATGYQSTWRPIFDGECVRAIGYDTKMCLHWDCYLLMFCVDISVEQLGLGRHRPFKTKYRWDYASLANSPDMPEEAPWSASIYRGLVPAKNIFNRDFAVNGAMV